MKKTVAFMVVLAAALLLCRGEKAGATLRPVALARETGSVIALGPGAESLPVDPEALGILPETAGEMGADMLRQGGGGCTPYCDLNRTLHATTAYSGSTPYRLSADAGGNLYISDIGYNKVYMVNSAGFVVRSFGTGATGTALGDIPIPEGSTAIGDTLYVASYTNQRIDKFQVSTGTALGSFSIPGAAAYPFGMALGPDGNLYLAQYNPPSVCTVKAINPTTGALVPAFGTGGVVGGACGAGTAPIQFNWPKGIAFDSQGCLYVTDGNNNRIVKMNHAGALVRTFSVAFADGLAIDRANTIYAADRANGGVVRYDSRGDYLGSYYASYAKVPHYGNFSQAGDVAVVNMANSLPVVWVTNVDAGAPYITRFETVSAPSSHNYQQEWGTTGTGNGQFNQAYGVAFDSGENVYVTDFSNNRVQKFDKFGTFLLAWGTAGTGNSQFSGPWGIAVDASNRVFVADYGNNRIQIFNTSGTYLSQFGSAGAATGQFRGPAGLAIDSLGYLYVTEFGTNNRVQEFAPGSGDTFSFYATWGTTGTADGQFAGPIGVAVDSAQGLTYNVDYSGKRLQIWGWNGNYVSNITPTGLCALTNPGAIWSDQRGSIYIADWGGGNIKQVDLNGNCVGVFGAPGSGNGQFNAPSGIAVSPKSGQIFVSEAGNNRVQRLGSPIPKNDTIGVWRPSARKFYLRKSNTSGYADITTAIQYAETTDLPVVGDWNGDGITTVGVFHSSTGEFRLRDANSPGPPDFSFTLGQAGDLPVVGDWNGDGRDGVGVYRPSTGTLYLRNALSAGAPDYVMTLGAAGDFPVAGDWNGDGQSSPGFYRPGESRFYLTDRVAGGAVSFDYTVLYGNQGDQPFTGDWVHQGSTGLGVNRSSTGNLYLKNALTGSNPDFALDYGFAGDVGFGGTWGPAPDVRTVEKFFQPLVLQ
jgi:tripartite motif-containing protein 71